MKTISTSRDAGFSIFTETGRVKKLSEMYRGQGGGHGGQHLPSPVPPLVPFAILSRPI